MGSNDKYINKPDDFSRKVGEKLREHRLPVDPGIWDALTDRFPSPERRIPAYWSWAVAGGAALVLALLLLLGPTDEPLLTQQSQSRMETKKGTVVPEIIPDDTENHTNKESVPKQIADQNSTMESEEITKPEMIVAPERTAKTEEITELAEAVKPEETAGPEKTLVPEESVQTAMKGLPEEESLSENDFSFQPQRELRSLMATLGSGGAPLNFSFGGYDPDDAFYDTPFPGGEFNNGDGLGLGNKYNLLAPNDYTDIEHRLPVSFSLTADFPIHKNVSLETGLSYTYLFSRFRRNDNLIYRGTLRQHYIGIPVNLRYTVWQNEVWNVYLLGGGSIEKGLRSVYKQEIEYNDGAVHHSNVYSGIDGFQFSAQGGAGFSYRLQGNLRLFGEPRIIYYFRNNQPMSARTENPWIFGLNMGIRLQFK